MPTIYVSNCGDDKNDGLTRYTPVRSWRRVKTLSNGNSEIRLMEGDATLVRLNEEIPLPRRHPE